MADKTYPYGKLNENDEGELNIAIAIEANTVRIDFGKPVSWIGLPPDVALGLADLLVKHANHIKRNLQ